MDWQEQERGGRYGWRQQGWRGSRERGFGAGEEWRRQEAYGPYGEYGRYGPYGSAPYEPWRESWQSGPEPRGYAYVEPSRYERQRYERFGRAPRRGPKGYQRPDERIHEDIYERLIRREDLDAENVTVKVEGGKVTLEGTVPERRMKHEIEDVVEECVGVTDVENRLRVHERRGFFGRFFGGRTVGEVMTREVTLTNPDATLQEAAQAMARIGAGVLPVGEGDRLVGMLTDRDIAIRAVAQGRDPKTTKVRDAMSKEVMYCYEDEDIAHVADNMAELQVRRLPVLSRAKRLIGIVALGDIAARTRETRTTGEALEAISQPGGRHTQH